MSLFCAFRQFLWDLLEMELARLKKWNPNVEFEFREVFYRKDGILQIRLHCWSQEKVWIDSIPASKFIFDKENKTIDFYNGLGGIVLELKLWDPWCSEDILPELRKAYSLFVKDTTLTTVRQILSLP
ncbi:MAG: hypothetical protein ACOX2O_02980 [Bdellovibrionota bacterium]|jgi:hypothetical protein